MAKIEHITTRSQLAKILVTQPVVIKFSAEYCGPCRASRAMFERLSNQETYKNIRFIEVDVEQGNSLAHEYKIKGIPAFVFVKNGQAVDFELGYNGINSEKAIVKKLDKLTDRTTKNN
jgi:thioredoxin 1